MIERSQNSKEDRQTARRSSEILSVVGPAVEKPQALQRTAIWKTGTEAAPAARSES